MGCDIHGAVELHRYDKWRHVGRTVWFVGRCYDAFGMLFGVRNSARFKPLFPKRGFPQDRSRRLNERIEDWGGIDRVGDVDFHSPSWFTLDELEDIDWSKTAESNDTRISVVDESGETQIKAGYIRGIHESLTDDELERAKSGERVRVSDTNGEARYAVHKEMTRREALSGAWEWLLFEYLPVLESRVEDKSDVRLTVWFDN